MLYAVDFELAPREGQEERVNQVPSIDPVLHWVGFKIEATDPLTALEYGIATLKQVPDIGEALHSLEASAEPV